MGPGYEVKYINGGYIRQDEPLRLEVASSHERHWQL